MSQDDKILLRGMVFYGFHGATAAEQEVGQRFVVDLEIQLDVSRAGRSDSIEDTVSYSHLYKATKDILEGPRRKLLENVAESLAHSILGRFDIESVMVRVKKPEVPMKGSILDYAAVEIFRQR